MSTATPKLTRRGILRSAAAASAALAMPYFVPRSAFGANDRVVTGHIGVRNQGTANLGKEFKNTVGALCDVDTAVLGKAVAKCEATGRKVETFGDYRKLLERKDIDAVVITTPDHWHARMTIDACQAGKDVYCEKPLSLTVREGRKMVEAARANNRVVQTGSQQRSDERFRTACELVRNGKIGDIKQVLCGLPGPNHGGAPVPDAAPPAELDYEMWLGPAPQRRYNEKRVHYLFRFFWDYSGGQMTNFGAHHIDIAHWGLGMDESGPVEIGGTATFHPENWHEVTETCRLTLKYASGAEVVVGQKQKDIPGGVTFVGSTATLFVDRKKITCTVPEILSEPLGSDAVRLYASKSHHQNFLDCIASREKPIADVEIGHRTATACHLANIAARLGRTIRWDPKAEMIIGDDEAAAMLDRPHRSPWTV
jgi:predicted dehydrogenase